MVKLNLEDRNKLISILEKSPLLGEYESRRQILLSAGLEIILPQINLQGSPFIVVSSMVESLEKYGRVTFEHEALGRLINRFKELIGADDEIQAFLDSLLISYKLMIPVKVSNEPKSWKDSTSSKAIFEKIIGENTLKDVAFLKRGLDVARAVVYIEVVNQWSGTGFMIGTSLLITNNHVIPNKDILKNTVFRFNYQLTVDGAMDISKDYRAKPEGLFYTNKDLDYTIVEPDENPGHEWGFLTLTKKFAAIKDSRVNIVQHPAGLPKQISMQNNFVAYADSRLVQYYASTMGGSSGSPVFNDKWQIVALHHAGGMLTEPGSMQKYFRNEGVAISAIVADCPNTIIEKLG